MAAKKTVRDPMRSPVVSRGVFKNTPNNVTRNLPNETPRDRNSGSPVGPEHPRTVPRGTGTRSPL